MTTTALSSPVFSSFTSAHFRPRAECPLVLFSGGGWGGGGVWEVGEEGAGSRRKREKLHKIAK